MENLPETSTEDKEIEVEPDSEVGIGAGGTERSLFERFEDTFLFPFIGVFYARMDFPLGIWEEKGHAVNIRQVTETDNSLAFELTGGGSSDGNVDGTYITTPREPFTKLGIKLPIMMMLIKPLGQNVLVNILVKDESGARRRLQLSNIYKTRLAKSFVAHIPLKFDDPMDWNDIEIPVSDLTWNLFGVHYEETIRVQVHPNCRLQQIYFTTYPRELDQVALTFRSILSKANLAESDPNNTLLKSLLLVPTRKPVYIPSLDLSHLNARRDIFACFNLNLEDIKKGDGPGPSSSNPTPHTSVEVQGESSPDEKSKQQNSISLMAESINNQINRVEALVNRKLALEVARITGPSPDYSLLSGMLVPVRSVRSTCRPPPQL